MNIVVAILQAASSPLWSYEKDLLRAIERLDDRANADAIEFFFVTRGTPWSRRRLDRALKKLTRRNYLASRQGPLEGSGPHYTLTENGRTAVHGS